MSIFGTNQVEEVIIGNAVASEGTVSAFKASAAEKAIKALAIDGGAAAEGKLFYLLQKTGGDAGKNLNYEFSDKIDPKKIERITLREYAPEVQKSVTVTGFDENVLPNTTYSVNIRLYNEGGSVSPENFRILHGFYSTGKSVANVTAADVRDGILKSLQTELISRGDNEFIVTAGDTPTALTVTGKYQKVVPGKITGRQIEFDVQTKVLDEAAGENLGLLSAEVVEHAHPGNGTAKQVINKEWFVKGFKYSPYRDTDVYGFDTPYYANESGIYNAVIITYKTSRISPTVEEQPRSLIVYVEKPTNDAAGNAETNSLLADLRTFIGDKAEVPADLDADNPE